MATSDITNQLKLLKNEMGTRLQQDSTAYAKLEAENKQLKAEIQKLKSSGNSNQSSVNNTEFQKLYNTISLGLAKSDVHSDELKSFREKIVSMEQQSSLVVGAVANQNTIIQQQSKIIYNGTMMQACEDKFKGEIRSLENKVKDVENQKILEKVGNVTVNSSNLSALRSQIIAAITTCEKNGVAIKKMKSEVTNVKNGKTLMNNDAPKTNPIGIALSVEELKKLKETIVKGVMQCDKNSKLIDDLKKQAEKEAKSGKTEKPAQKQQPESTGSNDTVRLHQTIKKQAENISKIAENYQNERAKLIQKSDYEMRSIRQNNKELLARVLVCEGAKDSIKKALKQAETVGPMLATMKAALEKRPEVKESIKNKKVDSLRLEIMNALVKCREHEKDIADLKNVEAENEAAKAKVDQLIQNKPAEKPVEKKATQAPKVVMQANAPKDGAKIAADMAAKMVADSKVEMTMDSDSESESEDEAPVLSKAVTVVEAAPVKKAAPKQAPKVVMQANAPRDGAKIAADMAAKMAANSKVEMTMDSDSESESEEEAPVKAAPVKKEAPTQAPKVVMQANAPKDGAKIAADMAAKMAANAKVEMTMDSDSESDSDDDAPVVVKKSMIRHGGRATACESASWETTENPVKTTKISGFTKITKDDRAPAYNTAKFWNNHGLLPEVDLAKFAKKPVSTPVEAPKKVETHEKVEAPKAETPAPKTAPKTASKKGGKKGKVRK